MTDDIPRNQEGEVEDSERAAMEARVAARLSWLDDETLARLDRWTTPPEEVPAGVGETALPPPSGHVSRRQFFSALAASGLALVATNAATAMATRDAGYREGFREGRTDLHPAVQRLQGVIDMYERLDRVGLDDLLRAGLSSVGLLLLALRQGSKLLGVGLDVAAAALDKVEGALAILQDGVQFVQGILDRLAGRMQSLWTLLGEVTGVAVPIAESIGSFFKSILSKIPFGVGAKITQVIDWIEQIIADLPEALTSVRTRLLDPLRAEWLETDSGTDLKTRLMTPIRQEVLAPAHKLLADIDALGDRWENQLQKPVQTALQERAAIRAQIVSYKQRNRLM